MRGGSTPCWDQELAALIRGSSSILGGIVGSNPARQSQQDPEEFLGALLLAIVFRVFDHFEVTQRTCGTCGNKSTKRETNTLLHVQVPSSLPPGTTVSLETCYAETCGSTVDCTCDRCEVRGHGANQPQSISMSHDTSTMLAVVLKRCKWRNGVARKNNAKAQYNSHISHILTSPSFPFHSFYIRTQMLSQCRRRNR